MLEQAIPYILMIVGIAGFELAGRKVWWAWYVNIANQGLWLFFAWLTGYWGFVLGTLFYTVVFVRNAIKWTKERHTLNAPPDEYRHFGVVEEIHVNYRRAAEIRVRGVGMYPENCPRIGTKAYFKVGETPSMDHNETWIRRPT